MFPTSPAYHNARPPRILSKGVTRGKFFMLQEIPPGNISCIKTKVCKGFYHSFAHFCRVLFILSISSAVPAL